MNYISSYWHFDICVIQNIYLVLSIVGFESINQPLLMVMEFPESNIIQEETLFG